MKHIILKSLLPAVVAGACALGAGAQEARPLGQMLDRVSRQFGVRLKIEVDTAGRTLPYAERRIRPYSVEETLANILTPFDYKAMPAGNKSFKIKPYEYYRRTAADGCKLLHHLSAIAPDSAAWSKRSAALRTEVRQRMGIDSLLGQCVGAKPVLGKVRKHDGYTVQNFSLETLPGVYVCGSIYTPASKGKHPLIICPNGHFQNGRYNNEQQLRKGTLARMGAICVDYDLYGWGESGMDVGEAAHRTPLAQRMQALNGLLILDFMIGRKDVDRTRVGCNGGSGGGSQTVLLSVLDPRYTAICPTVSLASHFDGGCPCESGVDIHLSGGGTCNPELAAMFAPRPMCVVSDDGDWTSTVPELEYPYLRRVYAMCGAEEAVSNVHLPGERHDFGPNKRKAVYDFFARTFGLDASKIDESKVTVENEKAMYSRH